MTDVPNVKVLLELTWPGDPVTKGRPRGRGKTFYTSARTRAAETALRARIDEVAAGAEPYDGPVGVRLEFFTRTRRRADGDNLEKLVGDCLQRGRRPTGGVILDDCQIDEAYKRVHRAVPGQEPRTEILVYILEGSG